MGAHHQQQRGFTIVELLLALTFFSFILLFASAGFIQINRSYTKGINVKRVHESGRLVLEDIARSIRTAPNANPEISLVDGSRRFCTGNVRYGWNELLDTSRVTFFGSTQVINLARATDGATNCTDDLYLDSSESFLDAGAAGGDPNDADGAIVVYDLNFTRFGDAIQIELVIGTTDPLDTNLTATDANDLLDTSGPIVTCQGSLISGDQFCDSVRLVTTVSLRT